MVTKYPIMALLQCQKLFQFKLIYSILGHYAAVLAGMMLQLFGFFLGLFCCQEKENIDSKEAVVNKKPWDVHAFKKSFYSCLPSKHNIFYDFMVLTAVSHN